MQKKISTPKKTKKKFTKHVGLKEKKDLKCFFYGKPSPWKCIYPHNQYKNTKYIIHNLVVEVSIANDPFAFIFFKKFKYWTLNINSSNHIGHDVSYFIYYKDITIIKNAFMGYSHYLPMLGVGTIMYVM